MKPAVTSIATIATKPVTNRAGYFTTPRTITTLPQAKATLAAFNRGAKANPGTYIRQKPLTYVTDDSGPARSGVIG